MAYVKVRDLPLSKLTKIELIGVIKEKDDEIRVLRRELGRTKAYDVLERSLPRGVEVQQTRVEDAIKLLIKQGYDVRFVF